jgi:hypothetical protein
LKVWIDATAMKSPSPGQLTGGAAPSRRALDLRHSGKAPSARLLQRSS